MFYSIGGDVARMTWNNARVWIKSLLRLPHDDAAATEAEKTVVKY